MMTTVPPQERPRGRLLACGVEVLSERALLALILRSGTNGASALDLAAELLADYGNVAALAAARPEELAVCRGVGTAKAAAVVAAFRLGSRAVQGGSKEPSVLHGALDVAGIAQAQLTSALRERVLVLVCDAANRLRRTVVVAEGSIDRSILATREILNAVLRLDGRSFALAHNHPSGDSEPSESDRKVTVEVAEGAKIVGLRFLSHVVVAGESWQVVS